MLADDNSANAAMIAEYLEAVGYQVATATDGVEAIARARERAPDVILMDNQMPNMDGLEAIRRLRGDQELRRIPIVALTALAMPGDRDRCLEAGADAYLAKPVGMKELHQTINLWLTRATG